MKKATIFACILMPILALGQASHYDNSLNTSAFVNGIKVLSPMSGAVVQFCSAPAVLVPCTNYATNYTDSTGSVAAANPITTDANGYFEVWATPGQYQYTFTYKGQSFGPFSVTIAMGNSGSVKSLNSIRFADQYQGVDIGAKVNAAIATCPQNCEVYIPAGQYSFSTTIALDSGITLRGAGMDGTQLTYTGHGIAISAPVKLRANIRDLSILTAVDDGVFGSVYGIKMAGQQSTIERVRVTGPFNRAVWVTGDGVSGQSGTIWLNKLRIDQAKYVGLYTDHVIELMPNDVSIYGLQDNTTSNGWIIDTGTSGVNAHDVNLGYGGTGALVIKNSSPGVGDYGDAPRYLFFDQLVADYSSAGDNIKFDSSLGSADVYATFINSWSGAAGLTTVGVQTASANGIGIYGGQGITFQGKVRLNANNGVYVNGASVYGVNVQNSVIVANNQANGGDGHGVYLNSALGRIQLQGNLIGNVIESGHQKYGVKVSAVSLPGVVVVGNAFEANETAPVLNSDTDAFAVFNANYPPAANGINYFGDNNFFAEILSGNPVVNFDANDYLQYDRTNNAYNFLIGGASKAAIDGSGIDAKSLGIRNAGPIAGATTVSASGTATAGGLIINNTAAPTTGANQVSFGSTTATTVGAAGAATALPATPSGYLIINIGGTNYKVPFYAN